MEAAVSFFVEQGSYGLMILALVAAGLGLPLPEDIVMISGAILAQRGITDLRLTVLALAVGVFLGDSALYWIARRVGPAIYGWKLVQRVLPEPRRHWIEERIAKHGGLVVFFARHVAGFRGPTFAIAAIHGISYPRFILWDMLALAISLPLWMALGWFFGSSMDTLLAYTENAEVAISVGVIVVVLLLITGHYVAKLVRKRIQDRADREEAAAAAAAADAPKPPPPSAPLAS
jgi:membrane protein DedA with SNARE-associated domain